MKTTEIKLDVWIGECGTYTVVERWKKRKSVWMVCEVSNGKLFGGSEYATAEIASGQAYEIANGL
jgi:hypothetical protein